MYRLHMANREKTVSPNCVFVGGGRWICHWATTAINATTAPSKAIHRPLSTNLETTWQLCQAYGSQKNIFDIPQTALAVSDFTRSFEVSIVWYICAFHMPAAKRLKMFRAKAGRTRAETSEVLFGVPCAWRWIIDLSVAWDRSTQSSTHNSQCQTLSTPYTPYDTINGWIKHPLQQKQDKHGNSDRRSHQISNGAIHQETITRYPTRSIPLK